MTMVGLFAWAAPDVFLAMPAAVIEIRPHRRGWQSFEGPGVGPFWLGEDAKQQAIDYAIHRMRSQAGEIHVLDAAGQVERVISFARDRAPDLSFDGGAR